MKILHRLAGLLVLPLVACAGGSSTPTSPSPAPALAATVTITDALTGAPLAGVTIADARLQAQPSSAAGVMTIVVPARSEAPELVTLTAPGYVPRSFGLKIPGAGASVTMIPSGFNLTAFDELARVSRLQRWTSSPPLRIVTRTLQYVSLQQVEATALDEVLPSAAKDGLEADLGAGLPVLTANQFQAFASVTADAPSAGATVDVLRDGVITVARYAGLADGSGYVGFARWQLRADGAVVAGTIMLDRDFDAGNSEQVRLVRLHELGHALGYSHVTSALSLMNVVAVDPTEFDRQATRIAFQRPPGNLRPDADPTSLSLNTLGRGMWTRGEGLPYGQHKRSLH